MHDKSKSALSQQFYRLLAIMQMLLPGQLKRILGAYLGSPHRFLKCTEVLVLIEAIQVKCFEFYSKASLGIMFGIISML